MPSEFGEPLPGFVAILEREDLLFFFDFLEVLQDSNEGAAGESLLEVVALEDLLGVMGVDSWDGLNEEVTGRSGRWRRWRGGCRLRGSS